MKKQKRAGWSALKTAALTLAAFVAAQAVTAQDIDRSRTITLQQSKQTRAATVQDIESQTAYKVAYNRSSFNEHGTVDYGRTQLGFGDVIDRMLENTGHTYAVENSVILIYRNGASWTEFIVTVLADRAIRGTVTDTQGGNVLTGVKVELLDGSATPVTTFADGRFLLTDITPGNHVLKLTSADGRTVRYREVTVPTGSNPDVALSMEGDLIQSADNQTAVETHSDVMLKPKTTAYFLPNTTDNTIRAFSDEAKSEYSFIPSLSINQNYHPKAAIKTNLLILGTATPNLAVEFALAKRWTLDIAAGYNPFQLQKGGINKVGFVQPEVRYWFCNRFEKHFVGLHGIYGRFNIGEVDFLTTTFEQNRYKGWGAGAGISYGYHLPMGKRWAWEFTVGAGYVYLEYDKFRCYECDEFLARKNRHYFGPTKAGVSLIFMIK